MGTSTKRDLLERMLAEKMTSFKELEELATKVTEQAETEMARIEADNLYNKILLVVKYSYIAGYVDGATKEEEK